MVKLNFQWRKAMGQYQTGELLYINKICVGSYYWNSSRSQGDEDESTRYVGGIDLPSLKDTMKRQYGGSPEDIKLNIEKIVTNWFKEVFK